MIADYQFAAGRQWQRYYEVAQIGALKGADTTCEPVDGGGYRVEFLTDVQRKAVAKLVYCRAILGETGNSDRNAGAWCAIYPSNKPRLPVASFLGAMWSSVADASGSDWARVFGYA